MCGVFGAVDARVDRLALGRACKVLEHRGPDGQGAFLDDETGVGLAHSRLSIIDLENGVQPLFDSAGECVLVCNGEVYDFERQRQELEAEGFQFKTRSDSEVILGLYQKHGLELFQHLRGEFAFLLFDKKRRRLIACRDRFGIKPLFVANTDDGGWVFASEIKAILASGLKEARMQFVLPFGERNENETLFRGIYDLPPGTALVVDLVEPAPRLLTYWRPDFPKGDGGGAAKDFSQWKAETDAALTEAIRLRLRADVPVGVYLSGGIDSALVAAKVRRLGNQPPLAFTVSFADMPRFNERSNAERIAEHIGVEHHVLDVETNDLWENLEACLWHSEDIIFDFAPVAKFLLSDFAKKHVSVVLTGEGADEVFLGYKMFRDKLHGYQRPVFIRAASRVREWFVLRYWKFLYAIVRVLTFRKEFRAPSRSEPLATLLPRQPLDQSQLEGRHPLLKDQYRRMKDHLRKAILVCFGDRMEMAHSIEGRVPFLDHHLFELARDIPIDFKIHQGKEKYILREIAADLVPEEVQAREKWPFSTTVPTFNREAYPACDRLCDTYLTPSAVREAGILKWPMIAFARFLRRFERFRVIADRFLLVACSLQILHHLFISRGAESLGGHLPGKMPSKSAGLQMREDRLATGDVATGT
ncbi:asparagine synthase (glutamine-hydrolyzing) [Myxococcus virescens]|uniref:asparagine synthase (glutamine-hydrolyzing) n=2 Tax=Myxococcus virescens TaxID=83456 RepID=A0ABY0MQ18_9BACT|nr:asparagine synthase (glutamine-hydrolyzing) [Myxococcus virescens]SDE21328.1 asparagine synthase (glutamine-hydrolysing) [Myxococcus virescens]